jgi:hypothetical protein
MLWFQKFPVRFWCRLFPGGFFFPLSQKKKKNERSLLSRKSAMQKVSLNNFLEKLTGISSKKKKLIIIIFSLREFIFVHSS